jgi:hypothetical protein
MRESAAVGAAANAITTEKSDPILAILMPNPPKAQTSLKPLKMK